jgi:hypothetical protein
MTKRFWTENELQLLRELYPALRTDEVAARLSRAVGSVNSKAYELGLKKTEEHLQTNAGRKVKGVSFRNAGSFKKGLKPWNKGVKWTPGGRCQETQFKPGQLPKNTLHDGAIRVRYDNRGKPVQYIRVSQAKWEYLSRYTWQQAHGPIQAGICIVHKDGNTMNCALDNLEAITRTENIRRNSIHHYPAEVKQVIRTLNKLKRAINGNEKQDR